MAGQQDAVTPTTEPRTPTSYLIFSTEDGQTFVRVGKEEAFNTDEAIRKYLDSPVPISENTTFSHLVAVAESYFKVRKPVPKVQTTVQLKEADWDSFQKKPEEPKTEGYMMTPATQGVAGT